MSKFSTFFKRHGGVKTTIISVVFAPVIYISICASLPYVSQVLSNLAIISSSVSMIDGGKIFFANKLQNAYDPEQEDAEDITTPEDEYVIGTQPESSEANSNQTSSTQETTPSAEKPANAGTVNRITYKASESNIYLPVGNNTLLWNCTSVARDKILETLKLKPKFKISADKSPEVLIMHTHATEAYEPHAFDWFARGYNWRSQDNAKNTTRVGDEIEKQLIEAGIGVVHDKTQHDNPSYNGAYDRSEVTVKNILKKYPSIKVVLDVHRDAIIRNDDTIVAPVAEINGKSAAQVMIISGCDNGKMNMPNYMENLKFSGLLQSQMGADYPGLARPIKFAYKNYNQHLTTGSILLEMGGHGNSLDEAIYTGELVGKSLAKALLSLK